MIGDIRRVTAGHGGEVALLLGSEKTALFEAGMAYCGAELVENIKKELKGRPLDYVLLSHTHDDHLGGLPFLRKEWPDLVACGAAHGKKTLEKPGALATIRKLGNIAAKQYLGKDAPALDYDDALLRIDRVVGDGDEISLGDRHIKVFETKGHTNCSLSYYIEEDSILFASESTGVMPNGEDMVPSILTSYNDAVASIEKCRAIGAAHIFSPHYMQVDDKLVPIYWDMAKEKADELKDFILSLIDQGLPDEEIMQKGKERFWVGENKKQQPEEAFMTNMKAKVNIFRREFPPVE